MEPTTFSTPSTSLKPGTFQYMAISHIGSACKEGLDCVVIVHNEVRVIAEFFQHYRTLGVTRFLVLDDRSTDGTSEWLRQQVDAIIFSPFEGTQFKTHKKQWRSEILDTYCHDRWVFAPDADEWFVYKDMETKPLKALISELDAEGARLLPAVMVDMYCDAPLDKHFYEGGGLLKAFPLFDAEGYYEFPVPARSVIRRFPSPWFMYVGGMRHRLFSTRLALPLPFNEIAFKSICGISTPSTAKPSPFRRALAAWYCFGSPNSYGSRIKKLHNVAKIPLVKWIRGLQFSGGAHSISAELPVSSRRAGLLHFKFTAGIDQITYIAARGEHAKNSLIYRRILGSTGLDESPACDISRRYESSASLGDLIH